MKTFNESKTLQSTNFLFFADVTFHEFKPFHKRFHDLFIWFFFEWLQMKPKLFKKALLNVSYKQKTNFFRLLFEVKKRLL